MKTQDRKSILKLSLVIAKKGIARIINNATVLDFVKKIIERTFIKIIKLILKLGLKSVFAK